MTSTPKTLDANPAENMKHDHHGNTSGVSANSESEIVIFTPATASTALFVLIVCVIPAIAMFGIVGNFFSVCVLRRDGLNKSYNVLLVALACSDTSFLIPILINGLMGASGFRYPEDKTSFLYIFFKILLFFDYGGALTSMTLPLLITLERIIVVFFPLTLARYTSSSRTFIAVAVVFGGVYGFVLYAVWTEAIETTLIFTNTSESGEGMIILANFRNSIDETPAMQEFGRTLFGPFPVSIVFSGCVILAIKVKLQSMQRKKMTNNTSGSSGASRVTLTLLVVCMVYTIASLEQFLWFSGVLDQYYKPKDSNGMFFVFMVEFNNMIVIINCSVNFLIYVFINKKFRATFIDIVTKVCKK